MTPGRTWAACLTILAAFTVVVWALAHPVEFALIVAALLWLAGVVGGGTAAVRWVEHRHELADANDRITALEDVIASLDQENARLHAMQTERDLLAGEAVHVPRLRVVPTQRTGREPWPPVARAVEAEATPVHDGLAVETFMEQVEAWGDEL